MYETRRECEWVGNRECVTCWRWCECLCEFRDSHLIVSTPKRIRCNWIGNNIFPGGNKPRNEENSLRIDVHAAFICTCVAWWMRVKWFECNFVSWWVFRTGETHETNIWHYVLQLRVNRRINFQMLLYRLLIHTYTPMCVCVSVCRLFHFTSFRLGFYRAVFLLPFGVRCACVCLGGCKIKNPLTKVIVAAVTAAAIAIVATTKTHWQTFFCYSFHSILYSNKRRQLLCE